MSVRVSIVVPVLNGRPLLAMLLASLRRQTLAPVEILVIDNGSEDGAPELAEEEGARVIRLGSNHGFARAVNRGIREASGEFIGIVNSDVILDPEWLARLMGALADRKAWFATGRILQASDPSRIDGTWDLICRGGCAWRAGSGQPDGALYSEPREIQFAPMTAALFRARLFQELGPLDERFESYLEDVEYGMRCAAAARRGRYVPGASARHHGSATLGRWHRDTVQRISRNQVFLVARYYSWPVLIRWGWQVLVAQSLWGLVALRRGAFLAYVQGKVIGLLQAPRIRKGSSCGSAVAASIEESEREIKDLQRATGFDRFWRAYFLLGTGGLN